MSPAQTSATKVPQDVPDCLRKPSKSKKRRERANAVKIRQRAEAAAAAGQVEILQVLLSGMPEPSKEVLEAQKSREQKKHYLEANVFDGLKNLNNGFDASSIYYFSEADFEIVLERAKELCIWILGIEPWYEVGRCQYEYYDCWVMEEEHDWDPDTDAYPSVDYARKAFENIRGRALKDSAVLLWSASFYVSDYQLSSWVERAS